MRLRSLYTLGRAAKQHCNAAAWPTVNHSLVHPNCEHFIPAAALISQQNLHLAFHAQAAAQPADEETSHNLPTQNTSFLDDAARSQPRRSGNGLSAAAKHRPIHLSEVAQVLSPDAHDTDHEEAEEESKQGRRSSSRAATTSSRTGSQHRSWNDPALPDDAWYSLSPHHVESKLPQWKRWHMRSRFLPHERPLSDSFKERLEALKRYKEEWGDCLVPRRFWEDWRLGIWCSDARVAYKEKRINPTQIKALEDIGFLWKVSVEVSDFNYFLHELRRFRMEFGQNAPAFKWRDPNADFTNAFSKWYHQQPDRFKQRLLLPDQVWKLKKIGYDMNAATGDDISLDDYTQEHNGVKVHARDFEWETMYQELMEWRNKYGTTIVPKQVWDNVLLGAWVHKVRKQAKDGILPQWQKDKLDDLLFVWKVEQQNAKWHFHLHEARRFKEVHGHAIIPADYNNPKEPQWVEAARWITRNAKHFSKGKLTDKRYQLIRDILGIKFVKKIGGPKRKGARREVPADAKILGPWSNASLQQHTGANFQYPEGWIRKAAPATLRA